MTVARFIYLAVPLGVVLGPFASAQQVSEQSATFTLINTVPKSRGFKSYIAGKDATNVLTPATEVADEAVGNGYSTGPVNWWPTDGVLVAEVPGKIPARLKSFIKPGESPLLLLKEQSGGGVTFSQLPTASNREGGFYDAINLSPRPSLDLLVDGKKISLKRGERVRISKSKTLTYEVEDGPKDLLESADDPAHVLLFLGDDNGKLKCLVVADYAP